MKKLSAGFLIGFFFAACFTLAHHRHARAAEPYVINGAALDVTCGAASAASAASPAGTTHFRVVAKTAAGRVKINAAATAADTLLTVGAPEVFRIVVGQTVNCIQDVGAGAINVTWLTANPTSQGGNYQPGLNP